VSTSKSDPQPRGSLPGHEPSVGVELPPGERRSFVSTTVEVEGREETKIVELPEIEPAPWDDAATLHIVGARVERADALEKVTGQARYTADIVRPGMLHAAVLRAPIARGRVVSLNLAPALATLGVHGAVVLADIRGIKYEGLPLLDDTIHYAGQPLAAIAADSPAIAAAALRAIELEVESSPHAITPARALESGAPMVRKHGNQPRKSPRESSRGDANAGLRDADVVIERRYRTPVALHSAMEPHGAVAEWSGDHLTVWESTQGIFNTRSDLARAFKLPLNRVRVMKDYMGGGFGAKNGASAASYIAVALARKIGRPVRCLWTREAEQTDAGNRPSTDQRVTLGATRDGRLTAIVMDAMINLGNGGWLGGPARIYHELYACPNVRTRETFVYTNAGPMSSFRAPGHVEGAFGLECAMDALAREIGIDPLELRRRNYATHDQAKGRAYSAKHLDRCYELGAARFGWNDGAHRGSARDGRLRRGRGMASLIWGAGGGPPAYATVRINPDGSVDVLTGAQDLGTGSRTIFAQVAAEALGARMQDVRTVLGDTERLPYAANSWGSITTASVAPAVRVAAELAKRRLLEAASALRKAEPESLEGRDSFVRVCDSDRAMAGAEIGGRLGEVMIMGQGSRGPNPDDTALAAFGAQFAEVEVDVETGQVRVLRIVSVHDSGRIVNPLLAESQLEGGIIQGIGYALFEERVMDERLGLQLNPTTHDYKIPTIGDVPAIDVSFVTSSDVVANHTGAKGLAEPPIIPTAPAIANAVADALGVDVAEAPLTPWRVLKAIG
jgi:CO/xanthine dehydrogenase Mo-binding subunit